MSEIATLYIDAAARQHPAGAAGAGVFNIDGETVTFSQYFGVMDNHEAEWAALKLGVTRARELNIHSLIIYTDSKIISDSFERGFVKNKVFKPYFEAVMREKNHFDLLLISHKPRRNNKQADRLAKDALFNEKKL